MGRNLCSFVCAAVMSVACFSAALPACAAETAQYRSSQAIWLRSEQSTKDDSNKLCRIPKDTVITVTDTEYGWGKTSYTSDGTTYTGWTALYLYTPVQGSDQTSQKTASASTSKSSGVSTPQYAQSTSRKSKIYTYLTDNLGFQRSAADAIMANIEAESSFNPSIEVEDTNGLMSIGLFQWNGDRCDNFKKYCNARSLEYGSVDAQLAFLSYELNGTYSKQYDKMLGFADSADGAYNAAYYWASHFEVCASSGWEKRAERASTLYKSE